MVQYNVQERLFSWMKSFSKTKEEYFISQNHLHKYLSLPNVTSFCGKEYVRRIASFLTRCIAPQEDFFILLKEKIRRFDEYSNSSLEGSNIGFKRS